MEKVLEAESTYGNWSLFNRFVMAAQLLDACDAAGACGLWPAERLLGAGLGCSACIAWHCMAWAGVQGRAAPGRVAAGQRLGV